MNDATTPMEDASPAAIDAPADAPLSVGRISVITAPSFSNVKFPNTATSMATIKNTGNSRLMNLTVSISPGGSHFFLNSDACSGTNLEPGATCTVTLDFAPTSAGSENATLVFAATSMPAVTTPMTATATAHLTIVLDTEWCSGLVTSENGLIDCGSRCEVDVASDVVLNAKPTHQSTRLCYFEGWAENGCNGMGSCTAQMRKDQTFHAHFTPHACVDPVKGNDNNTGTCTTPFKTIRRALAAPFAAGDVIQLKPGVYSKATGELFPITLPSNVSIIGNEATKGLGPTPTEINGCGPPTIANQETFWIGNTTAVTVAGIRVGVGADTSNSQLPYPLYQSHGFQIS